MKISFISNIKITEYSGGMSGINKSLYQQLERYFEVCDYSYINPGYDLISKVLSKLLRLLGFKGNYHFFSNRRLNKIKNQFNSAVKKGDVYFFLGFTSWIHIKPNRPYFCYNDASFSAYVDIYNNKNEFSTRDLKRIFRKEKKWLTNAQIVFFNSDWALQQTKQAYKMAGNNFINIGFAGFTDIPESDIYQAGFNFLFISREFIPKGGLVVAEAIKLVRQTHPEAKVWVVGDAPPDDLKDQSGLEYKGFFSKSDPESFKALMNLFAHSFCMIHPTLKDINPLVIYELAYFGCPAIASNRFAIPEFIEDGKTGLLVDNPRDVAAVAAKMCYMIEHPDMYRNMRQEVRSKALNYNTWDKVGDKLKNLISM